MFPISEHAWEDMQTVALGERGAEEPALENSGFYVCFLFSVLFELFPQ